MHQWSEVEPELLQKVDKLGLIERMSEQFHTGSQSPFLDGKEYNRSI